MDHQCFLCTTPDSLTLITLHDDHRICGDCLKSYAKYNNIVEIDIGEYEMLNPFPFKRMKCPGRQCYHKTFGFEKLVQCFTDEEYNRIYTNAKLKAGIKEEAFSNEDLRKTQIIFSPSLQIEKCYLPACTKTEFIQKFETCTSECKFLCCKLHQKGFAEDFLQRNLSKCFFNSFFHYFLNLYDRFKCFNFNF